jgi:antitoxin (DNA-binding transcriptional repressor) of toxin-antitoxin stability system
VAKTGKPVPITRFGHAVAEIVPPGAARSEPRLGTGIGSAIIHGDIVGPIGDASDWEVVRDPDSVLDPKNRK